jgi:hypothetical protein
MPLESNDGSFGQTVTAFAAALVDPSLPPPAGILGREGSSDRRRFAVYRNNVAVSLIASLAARFPVTRRLIGEDFFRAMARAYAAQNKPETPVLIHYGRAFPAFIAAFEPARDVPYLADVACLENAWVQAYHAAEAQPFAVAGLAALDVERLAQARAVFHPAAHLLSSDHPIASIWAAHQGAAEPAPVAEWRGEAALITRPDEEVFVRILPQGGYAFASALFRGASIGEAHETIGVEGFDAGAHLVGLIEAGALVKLEI